MKVSYLVQQFPPEVGAGPARVGELGLRWKSAGVDLSVITAMPNRPEGRIHAEYRGKLFSREEWNGIEVFRSWLYASPKHGFARTILNNLTFMATGALSGMFRSARPDVLIASSPPFFVHLAGEAVRRRWRVPMVLEVRDLWPDYLVGMGAIRNESAKRALFGLERYLLKKAAHVVVVTESFRTRIIEKGVSPDRVTVVPNGVDATFYYRIEEAAPVPGLERESGHFIVGYLGNFGASQGLSAIVEAAKILEEKDPTVHVVLVGDGTEKAAVLRKVEELAPGNISVHPPIVKEQTRAFYNACDVCLVPLADIPVLQETIPSKIFEVLACERPVVASLGGEAAVVVERSGGGVVAAPEDANEIANAILRLRNESPEARSAMGRRGREFVMAHYSRDVLADRYRDVLESLVDGGRVEPESGALVSEATAASVAG